MGEGKVREAQDLGGEMLSPSCPVLVEKAKTLCCGEQALIEHVVNEA